MNAEKRRAAPAEEPVRRQFDLTEGADLVKTTPVASTIQTEEFFAI